MNGLEKELSLNYGFEVKNIVPYKDMLAVETNNGRRLVKKINLSPERILFIHGAKEHLFKNGFVNIDRYEMTQDEKPFFFAEGNCFVVMNMYDGRECSLENDNEAVKAARTLAKLHLSSVGYCPSPGSKIQDELGNLPFSYKKRLEDIRKLRKLAIKSKTRFDHMYMEHVDYFTAAGEEACNMLDNSGYIRLVEEAKKTSGFCHHDYTHHNILIHHGNLHIINFDICCFELRIYDLANLIRRKMRKCNWNIDKAKLLVRAYSSVYSLSELELDVMKPILLFPQKFWRVVNRYYNSRRSWSEYSFAGRLKEVIDELDGHRAFMERYDELRID